MSDGLFDGVDVEMEPAVLVPDLVEADTHGDVVRELALVRSLSPGFDLPSLLQFIPDPKLKARADASAAAALAVEVKEAAGLHAADAAIAQARADLDEISACFEYPTKLAYDLHKRLTGLRGDFRKDGEAAIEAVNKKIYSETQRLKRLGDDARRAAQEQADREAREALAKAAAEAKKAGAPKELVQEMKAQAKTATAPPVASPRPVPTLLHTATVEHWVARLKGTLAEAEPNPEMVDLTDAQRLSVLQVLKAIGDGKLPIAAISLNWSLLNTRAAAERTTLAIPGIEAVDIGGTRKKPGKK